MSKKKKAGNGNQGGASGAQKSEVVGKKPSGPLPGHETQSDEMMCPSCGRFVGAVTKCPYCGSKVTKRMSLMATRWAAILLSTVGLFLLYLMARSHEPATIHIEDISTTMNFGNVRIVGQVKADARMNRTGNGMSFSVNDGTGDLRVFIDDALRKEMEEKGLVPKKGNEISFIAQLTVSADQTTARLNSIAEDSFSLTAGDGVAPGTSAAKAAAGSSKPVTSAEKAAASKAEKPTALKDVTPALDGKFVTLEGVVESLTPPPADSPKRPYYLKLREGEASVSVKMWQDSYDQIADKDVLVGSRVRLRAAVGTYEGKVDVKLVSPEQFTRLAEDEGAAAADEPAQKPAAKRDFSRGRSTKATYVSLADVTPAQEGETVTVRARVENVTPPQEGTKQPYSIYLRDGDVTLRASCFPKSWDVIAEANRPRPDAVFELTGTVEVFQGKPQLKVKSGYNVKLVDDTPASQPAVDAGAAIPAAEAAGKIGEVVTLKGVLGASVSLKSGVKYPLTDASGTVPVVIWNSRLPESVLAALDEGVEVAVRGVAEEYEGACQVVMEQGALTVLADRP